MDAMDAMDEMDWVDLRRLGLGDRERVGAKAAVLGALLKQGLPVPPGLVVLDTSRWKGHCPFSSPSGFIARSSAPVEDGAAHSFAGQFDSIAGLRTAATLRSAVRRVSRPGSRARAYAARLGVALPPRIPVLVQQQVAASRAGVLFTADPLGQRRGCFSVAWSERVSAVTDGRPGALATFNPFALVAAAVADPLVARALPQLVEHAFAAQGLLSRETPLDLEWLLDRDGQLWIVQARPVTSKRRPLHAGVQRLVSEGWLLVSPQPVSTLAQHQFAVAAQTDARAAFFHHAHFERRVVDGWLLARRSKTSARPQLDGDSPRAFARSFLSRRRGNLAFAARAFAQWTVATRAARRCARRVFACDLQALSDRQLRPLLRSSLRTYDRVRRVHAALWYPVDFANDLDAFERKFGPAGLCASLPRPPMRTARDRDGAALVRSIRLRHGKTHPRWDALANEERAGVHTFLRRHPYAFGSAAEVQDSGRVLFVARGAGALVVAAGFGRRARARLSPHVLAPARSGVGPGRHRAPRARRRLLAAQGRSRRASGAGRVRAPAGSPRS
ncbi:MAG: PEP/pyruvate-binding domain-containing protein [Myxococcales bacterium]